MPEIDDSIRERLKKQPKWVQALIEEFDLEVTRLAGTHALGSDETDDLKETVETLESDARAQSARIKELEESLKVAYRASENHRTEKARAQMKLQQLQAEVAQKPSVGTAFAEVDRMRSELETTKRSLEARTQEVARLRAQAPPTPSPRLQEGAVASLRKQIQSMELDIRDRDRTIDLLKSKGLEDLKGLDLIREGEWLRVECGQADIIEVDAGIMQVRSQRSPIRLRATGKDTR